MFRHKLVYEAMIEMDIVDNKKGDDYQESLTPTGKKFMGKIR